MLPPRMARALVPHLAQQLDLVPCGLGIPPGRFDHLERGVATSAANGRSAGSCGCQYTEPKAGSIPIGASAAWAAASTLDHGPVNVRVCMPCMVPSHERARRVVTLYCE